MNQNNTQPKKKCNFCKRSKKKFSKWIYFSIYFIILAIWGQIELIRFIIKLLHL
jgi:hypothetical protein